MIPADLISKKRDGESLSAEEIKWFIDGFLSGTVSEGQMTALLMSVYFRGMSDDETFSLVDVMLNSGARLDFSSSESYVADKHSTGGIGDKVSLVIAPLMVSAGLKIPMIAGRGLGFTGGTVDKLETIPGFNPSPSLSEFKNWVDANGCAIIGQSGEICPADKKIYALRDQTGTVPSIPLICGSIMSKKIAEGISGLVLDVKVGNGAFMKTLEEARELGAWMKKIGAAFNVETDIVFTSMDQPLGRFAGMGREVSESIACLEGNGPSDLMEVVYELGAKLLLQAGVAENKDEAVQKQQSLIDAGKARDLFENMVAIQGGDLSGLETAIRPKYEKTIVSESDGIITSMDTEAIGWGLVELGCGRKRPNEDLDHSAGMEVLKKVGDEISKGEPVFRVFNSSSTRLDSALRLLKNTVKTDGDLIRPPLILGYL